MCLMNVFGRAGPGPADAHKVPRSGTRPADSHDARGDARKSAVNRGPGHPFKSSKIDAHACALLGAQMGRSSR